MHEEVGGEASLVVLVRAPEGSQAADSADVGEEIAADLREHDGIESVHAFSDPGMSDPLSSDDGRTGTVVAHIEGTLAEQIEISTELVDQLSQERGDGTEVLVGVSAPMIASNSQQVIKDLGLAEHIAVPITLVLLSAVLGVVTLVFQHGWLSGFLGFTRGPLDMSMPVLLFCIAFGLSVDYELFLIGRMKEMWEQTGSNRMAVVPATAARPRAWRGRTTSSSSGSRIWPIRRSWSPCAPTSTASRSWRSWASPRGRRWGRPISTCSSCAWTRALWVRRRPRSG